MQGIIPLIVTALGILLFFVTIYFIIIAMFYNKVKQGQALVRSGFGGTKVAIGSGMYSIPSFHQLEAIDISMKKIQIECLGNESLICKDNLRADLKAAFYIRVKYEVESIAKVAQTIGASNASNPKVLKELFKPKFSEALKTVSRKFTFEELLDSRGEFRNEVVNIIGTDLNGFTLEDCAIDYIEKSKPNNL